MTNSATEETAMPFPYRKIINLPGLDVTDILHHSRLTGSSARSTKDKFSCGTGRKACS
ncbi:hypothetical protein [Microcoleus sp. B9-D4]|uniref:hypothetical protein n=1 Tax=Microcoleus sp. B9-D4 TaxID=2818711 RepID=UPI002FCEEAEB